MLNLSTAKLKPDVSTQTRPADRKPSSANHETLKHVLDETERTEILRALEQANFVVGGPNGAAALLGLKRNTLQFRMQKLGIHVSRTAIDERRQRL